MMIERAPLTTQVVDGDGHTVVRLGGELDLSTSPDLDECLRQLTAAGSVRLLLDLSNLDFCDSTGLGRFVSAARRCGQAGGWLRLAAPQPHLLRVLQVAGLLSELATYPTLAAARSASDHARLTDSTRMD